MGAALKRFFTLSTLLWSLVVVVVLTTVFAVVQPLVWRAFNFDPEPVAIENVQTLATLMAVVVALIGLGVTAFGITVYRLLANMIREEIVGTVEERFQRASAASFMAVGWALGRQYSETKASFLLDQAIDFTREAYYRHAKLLDEEKPGNEELICVLRNNWAWFLAKKAETRRLDDDETKLARQFADYIESRILKYPTHARDWVETIQCVRRNIPQSS